MRAAGIRQARQHLSILLDEVGKGHEVLITDRGRPVARLVPPLPESTRPWSSHRRFRASIRLRGRPLSESVSAGRADRV